MTLDEAITHASEKAETTCGECRKEHFQLADWLTELKILRNRDHEYWENVRNIAATNFAPAMIIGSPDQCDDYIAKTAKRMADILVEELKKK